MKKYFLLFLCLNFLGMSIAQAQEFEGEIHQQDYLLSTEFGIISNSKHLNTIVKSSLRLRACYDLYDAKGRYQAEGIARVFTLGAFYAWGTEIDVYDASGRCLGLIDGQFLTGAAAKYSIYNDLSERVGIAYLDRSKSTIIVVNPNYENVRIAAFKRNFVQDNIDDWKIHVFETDTIDLRILKIFAAFIIDNQEYFKEDL